MINMVVLLALWLCLRCVRVCDFIYRVVSTTCFLRFNDITFFFTVPSNNGILLSCIANFTTHTFMTTYVTIFPVVNCSNILVATFLYHHIEFTFFSNIWLFPYNLWYMLQFLSSSHLHIQINECTKYCIPYSKFSVFCGGVPVPSYRVYLSKMFGCVHAM